MYLVLPLCSYWFKANSFSSVISGYRDVPQSNVSPLLPRRLLLLREELLGLPQSGACGPANSLVAPCVCQTNKILYWSSLQTRGERLVQSGYLAQFFARVTQASIDHSLKDLCGLGLRCLGERTQLLRRTGRISILKQMLRCFSSEAVPCQKVFAQN